jgi:nucleoside-diphosphate-sugar epimerase
LSAGDPVIIIGPGYTGGRLALRLAAQGVPVFAAARDREKLSALRSAGVLVLPLLSDKAPKNARLVYSVPPMPVGEAQPVRDWIHRLAPVRVVYISSTGVYGNQQKIDANSPTETSTERARLRLLDEAFFGSGPWSSLILRPAAIYGPGRGVHVSVRQGLVPRGSGATITSRIHVDDLVRIIEAGLYSDLTGSWPVADEVACASREIAAWCARQMSVEYVMKASGGLSEEGRDVDGSEIVRLLRIKLLWPSWQAGIPACMAEEARLATPAT